MTLPNFDYIAAKSMEEAAGLSVKLGGKSVIMNGGTDVIPVLKDRVIRPEYVIDIKTVAGHRELDFVPGQGLKIGALTTLHDIEISPVVKKELPAVAQAAHYVASKQIRCKGTMAGNICNASPSADTCCILMVMDAKVKTVRAEGQGRELPVNGFFKGVKKTALEPGELVTEIFVPELKSGEGSAYFKHAVRKAMDLAIIGVASWVKMDGNKIVDCRIAIGGAATTPIRAAKAEEMLIGQEFSDELLEKAAEAAAAGCSPISDVRASAEYRTDMVRVFTKRSFKKALEDLKA